MRGRSGNQGSLTQTFGSGVMTRGEVSKLTPHPRKIPHPLSPFGELLQIGFTTNDSEFLLVGAGRDVCRGARIEIHVHD